MGIQKYSYGTAQPDKDTIIVKAHLDPNGKHTKEELIAMVDKKNKDKSPSSMSKHWEIKFFKSLKQAKEYKPTQNNMNELKRIQQLAGILKESQLNELEKAEDTIDRSVINLAIQELGNLGVRLDSAKGAELSKELSNTSYSKMFQVMAKYYQDHDALEKVKEKLIEKGYPVGSNTELKEETLNEDMPSAQELIGIIAGIGSLGLGGIAISKIQDYIKKKNPEVYAKLQQTHANMDKAYRGGVDEAVDKALKEYRSKK